ncbi:MAG: MBL fold metallo-hydrolase [Thiohalocapsa sp.]|uniref:MBL fold metallo-hydrolase n=1 Tax=Thiohalocapsa sp. TaxID=2497641 RepID=UPI0025D2D326|nr:MBL fold metallo-hydrolase [Thiohalocapsa sp.]
MDYRIIPVTPFQQNCTLLRCADTGATAIVDPGGEPERITAALTAMNAEPLMILLTHGHLDHVGAAPMLAEQLGLPILGPHQDDAFWLDALPQQAQMFGFPPQPAFRPERWLTDGEVVTLGERRLEVLHCPGHTPGHVVLFDAEARLAQVGDVLFAGGIGRTDFPRGSHGDLLRSIRERLFPLGDDVRFIPGHGPMSTFGEERRHNPFVRAGA